jgi:thymidylate synthase
MINIIFAVDQENNFCSSDKITLPWQIVSEDMKWFKTCTLMGGEENAVIMGKGTFASMCHKPLKGRYNIVVSKSMANMCICPDNITICSKLTEAILKAKERKCKYIFIIGGISLIEEALQLPELENIMITTIDNTHNTNNCIKFNYKIPDNFIIKKILSLGKRHYVKIYAKERILTDESKYIDLVNDVLVNGESRDDRTGVGTISVFGRHFTMDISNSFPLLTTKRVFWRGVAEELLFFISGKTDTKILESKGVNIWKGNTSREFLDKRGLTKLEEGEYGKSYGYQWRKFGDKVDQLQELIDGIKNDPYSRRHYMTAWNPLELNNIPLPACHLSCQFYVSPKNNKLSCQVYMRSCDIFLGLPFNIASYALLTYMICHLTNLQPENLSFCLGDAHIYKTHIEQCKEMIYRELKTFPTLKIIREVKNIDDFKFEDFEIVGYNPHPTIKAEMAV